MAKHRLADRRARRHPVRRTVEMVDLGTGTIHLLTRDVTADRWGRYAALCGVDVLPAAMVEPGRRYCQSCRSTSSIPSQRSG